MQNKRSILLVIICFQFLSCPVFAETVKLNAGTFVPVLLNQTLSYGDLHTGDFLPCRVGADVVVDDKTVIESNTLVTATVSFAEEPRMGGRAGKLSIYFVNTTAVDGQRVLLQGSKTYVGEDETTGTVVVGVVLCPLALINKGGEATLGEGTQGHAVVATNIDIEVPN